MGEEEQREIVLDHGTDTIKAGFGGDSEPCAEFPSVVGCAIATKARSDSGIKDVYIGHEAIIKRKLLKTTFPIEHGMMTSLDCMEKIWQHTFSNELRVDPQEHPLLSAETPFTPKQSREKFTEKMFESFGVPAMHICASNVLALYATGRTTGLVIGAGEGVSLSLSVYEGYSLPHTYKYLPVNGNDITRHMASVLHECGHEFTTSADMAIVRDIKESMSYVTMDFDAEMKKFAEKPEAINKAYRLPDGRSITIGTQRFRSAEWLFNPSLIGSDAVGIHTCCHHSITKCDPDIRNDMYRNIVLAGGCTLFPGLQSRLMKELHAFAPHGPHINVTAPPERKNLAWIGGSVISSLTTIRWMHKEDYEESGPSLVHRLFF